MKIYLDDMRQAPEGFCLCRTYSDCINQLKNNKVEIISLDHDLGTDKTGYSVCLWMVENEISPEEIYIHSANPVGQSNMVQLLDRYMPLETKIFVKMGDAFFPVYRTIRQ